MNAATIISIAAQELHEGALAKPANITMQQRKDDQSPEIQKDGVKKQALLVYGKVLEVIVTVLIFIMVLALFGALAGLILDFVAAANSVRSGISHSTFANGIVDAIDRQLVIDVLSIFVLIELFRTFTDYVEFNRVRLRVVSEVGIAFVLREIFIGLYGNKLGWAEIMALSVLLAVLVTTRIASVQFHPKESRSE